MLGEKTIGRLGFRVFFLWGGGVGLTEKASQFFLLKEKIISNFYFQKYSTGFTWVIFLKPPKEWTKKGLHSFDWRFGIGSKVSFVCWWTSGSFQNDTQVDVKRYSRWFKMHLFLILLCSCDPTGGYFWILRGVQLSQPAVKVGVDQVYNSALSSSS